MAQSGRAPRKTPLALSTDPPLPSPLATQITAQSTGKETSNFSTLNQPPHNPKITKSTDVLSLSRHSSWATKPGDSQRLHDTIRDLQRFLTALPFPLIKITPVVIARIICRLLATQGVMPTNVVSAQSVYRDYWRKF